MDQSAAKRIRDSFTALRGEEVTRAFYERLFREFPEVRSQFPADMERQKQHLAAALALVSRNADRMEMLEEPLMLLGAQHLNYGTQPQHYPMIRDTLIATLREASGEAWTEQLEADWFKALNHIAAVMLKGAAKASEAVAAQLEHQRPRGRVVDGAR